MTIITLPWFNRVLNPNVKTHWAIKHKASKKQRRGSYYAAKAQKTPTGFNLSIELYPPCKRKRDQDNCIAALKSAFDGLSDAWGVDDSLFNISSIEFKEAVEHGKIIIKAN